MESSLTTKLQVIVRPTRKSGILQKLYLEILVIMVIWKNLEKNWRKTILFITYLPNLIFVQLILISWIDFKTRVLYPIFMFLENIGPIANNINKYLW